MGVYLDTLTVKIVCMGKETSGMCFGVVRMSRLVSGGRIGGVRVTVEVLPKRASVGVFSNFVTALKRIDLALRPTKPEAHSATVPLYTDFAQFVT